jgi:hypothetical protein
MKKIFFALCICLLAWSCQDDGTLPNNGEKLTAVYFDGIKYYEFDYNTDGFLTAEKSKFSYHRFNYDRNLNKVSKEIYSDSRLTSSNYVTAQEAMNRSEWVNPQNTALTGTLDFEFDGENRLVKSTELTGYSEYDYDNNNRIKTRRMYHDGILSGTREYEYDIAGNVLVDNHYFVLEDGSKQLTSITEYEYDNMRNPFFNLKPDRFPVENINPNNITRKIYTVYDYPDAGLDVSYTYNYNSLGLPTERSDGQSYRYSR